MATSSAPSAPSAGTPATSPWIDKYLEHVRVERRLAARTVELYAIHLATLADLAAAAALPLERVGTAHIRRWMAQMHGAGREPRGIALVLSCWRSFYRWLGQQGQIPANPVQDVHAPKAARPLPKALAVDDAVRLAEWHDSEADPWIEARSASIALLPTGTLRRLPPLPSTWASAASRSTQPRDSLPACTSSPTSSLTRRPQP